MDFTTAVNEAISILKRPDKILDVRREINAAVTLFSLDANFPRDIDELLLNITATEYSQNIPYSSFTRFRKIQFIKRAGTYEYLKELDVKMLVSSLDVKDRWYIAGSGIRINQCKLSAQLDVGYYQYPPILTDVAPTYWILDQSPYMVIDKAVSKIFTNIGDKASSDTHAASAREAFAVFRNAHGAT